MEAPAEMIPEQISEATLEDPKLQRPQALENVVVASQLALCTPLGAINGTVGACIASGLSATFWSDRPRESSSRK
jgi:hypothetical protein